MIHESVTGFVVALALALALGLLARWHQRRRRRPHIHWFGLVTFALIGGLIGAIVAHVLRDAGNRVEVPEDLTSVPTTVDHP